MSACRLGVAVVERNENGTPPHRSDAANFVLGERDGKKRFADHALAMSKAFSLCRTLDEAKAVRAWWARCRRC
nr:type I restriction enzyme endonuclease domain-containing protein [Paraburkholderia madseniana]